MATNVEIKARAHDLHALAARLRALCDAPEQTLRQVDTFYCTSHGRLKLRERAGADAQLIYYERTNQPGPKRSDYSIFTTPDPDGLKSVLDAALGTRGIVRKVRHLFLIGQTRVHLDEVEALGDFIELEVVLGPLQTEDEGRRIADELIQQLGISGQDLLEGAYMDMLEESSV